ncbi:MAG: hypothetical protein KC561_00405 [Myxococcales bacterium]|nr:hypothetical protein [Myxococcales bacterium]
MSDEGYIVRLLAFPGLPSGEAARALSDTFGIPLETAAKMVARAPVKVKSRCSRSDAKQYVNTLLQIGADVSVMIGDSEKSYYASDYARRSGRKKHIDPIKTSEIDSIGDPRLAEAVAQSVPKRQPATTDQPRYRQARPVSRADGDRIEGSHHLREAGIGPYELGPEEDDASFLSLDQRYDPGQSLAEASDKLGR